MEALNVILFILFVALVLWTIFRRGKRLAAVALRGLAMQKGGIYRSTGLFGYSKVSISNGVHSIQVKLTSNSWLGNEFIATFQAPWNGNRPQLPLGRPSEIAVANHAKMTPSKLTTSTQLSLDGELGKTASQLEQFTAVSEANLWTQGNQFYSQAILNTAAVPQVVHWMELVLRLYSLVAAETEAGIQFSSAEADQSPQAICQVCGIPPIPSESVLCRLCGAPHHADCWEYNKGCAIYGCREKTYRQDMQ